MREIPLDARLQAVADLVREGSVVADVGTDHGYLVCHLVASRKCPRAIACDINEAPLAQARRTILAHNLDARILTVRCDGLGGVPHDAVGDIVVAGMGGDLIARILCDWAGCQEGDKHFVLQPMSKAEHLRAALYRGGFLITNEVAVLCGRFVYPVLTARYTGACVEVSEFFAWTGKLWEAELEPPVLAYLTQVHETLCKKAQGVACSGRDPGQALEYARMAERICQRIEKGC